MYLEYIVVFENIYKSFFYYICYFTTFQVFNKFLNNCLLFFNTRLGLRDHVFELSPFSPFVIYVFSNPPSSGFPRIPSYYN